MTKLTRALRLPVLLVALALAVPGCKATTGAGPTPVTVVNGVIDCAAPSLFQVATFATMIPIVAHAVGLADPFGALSQLLLTYGRAEVDCVAAYERDQSSRQLVAAPSNQVVKTRISVTAEWLARENSAGVGPIINYGVVAP